jgi:hypothetical protein
MRAVVLQAAERAVGVAPEHEIAPKRFHRVRLVALHLHRLRHHVPLAEDAGGQALLDLVFVGGHGAVLL